MQFQQCIEGCLELTNRPVSLETKDREWKLTFSWTTWLYIDCCCDTYPTRQRSLTLAVPDTDLVDENGLPKLFYESDNFL